MSIDRKRILLFLERCKNMKQLVQVHAQIITGGLANDSFALSRLMAFCSDPARGSLTHAQLLFETMERPTLCIANTMIKAYLVNQEYIEMIKVYRRMLRDGLYPDNYTFPYVLKSCASMQDARTGASVHTQIIKIGFESDTFVGNTLILLYMACGETNAGREIFDGIRRQTAASWTVMISGYSKMGEIEAARSIFDEAPSKDRGMWGSMISGYVQNNCFKEALLMFRMMQIEGPEPDEGVFVSALCACAQLGATDIGIWIHHYLQRVAFKMSVQLGTALIDMHVKCGNLALARKLFDSMPEKDTICWNVMISGAAMHGDGKGALDLFATMKGEGFRADGTTFIALLTACSHSGLVQEGLALFNSMSTMCGIEPRGEHYGCMVDFLGRAGMFEEAKDMIGRMPASASPSERAVAWRALLSSCWNHGEFRLAEVAVEHLLQLEDHSGVYVLLANVYENCGRHEDARRMRKRMRERRVLKTPGCSSIELGGRVHEFVAGEQAHLRESKKYEVLQSLNDQLAMANS